MADSFRIVAYREQPELGENVVALEAESFPRYIEEDVVWAKVSPGFYDEYARWCHEDGQLFDPGLRAVERMGGELIRPEAESAVFEASIADWQSWTGMKFPASGDYWLPGGLSTLHIDQENNSGRHCEPHVWFRLSID